MLYLIIGVRLIEKCFINESFDKAINDYLNFKNNPESVRFNSFLTVVIRLLVTMYSELDIINPYITDNDDALKDNLAKYEYPKEDIEFFLENIQMFFDIEKDNSNLNIKRDNPYFITIQKQLIDMFVMKKLNFHLTNDEIKNFYNLLYTENTPNVLRLSYNYLMCSNASEIDNYFKREMKDNIKIIKPTEKKVLNMRAYEILNYSMDNINEMDSDEIDKLNHQVDDYFKIRENAINKEYLLDEAVKAFDRKHAKVTTGNGYVDILLVMSVITTFLFVVGLVLYKVL